MILPNRVATKVEVDSGSFGKARPKPVTDSDTIYRAGEGLSVRTGPSPGMADEPVSMDIEGQIDEQTLADVALVVECLAAFAGRPETLDTRRERRAWELISGLAEDLDMAPSDLLRIGTYLQP